MTAREAYDIAVVLVPRDCFISVTHGVAKKADNPTGSTEGCTIVAGGRTFQGNTVEGALGALRAHMAKRDNGAWP